MSEEAAGQCGSARVAADKWASQWRFAFKSTMASNAASLAATSLGYVFLEGGERLDARSRINEFASPRGNAKSSLILGG
jgi:hypothetical protein